MEMAIVTAVTDPGVLADFPHFPNTARVKNNIVALWLCRVYQVCLAATAPTFASKTRSNFRLERDQAALRTGPRRQPSSVSSTICHRSIRYHWGGMRREQPGLSLLQQHGGLSSRLAAADLYGMYVIIGFCGVVLLRGFFILRSPFPRSSPSLTHPRDRYIISNRFFRSQRHGNRWRWYVSNRTAPRSPTIHRIRCSDVAPFVFTPIAVCAMRACSDAVRRRDVT